MKDFNKLTAKQKKNLGTPGPTKSKKVISGEYAPAIGNGDHLVTNITEDYEGYKTEHYIPSLLEKQWVSW